MKRKIFSMLLLFVLISCVVGLFACAETPDSSGGNENSLQDYSASDKKIVTTLNYDIAESTEAFYIGSNAITGIEVDGQLVSADDYLIRNKYLLMQDGWFANLGVGKHTFRVVYKTKALSFTFNISDNKDLLFEIPEIDKTYIPIDDVNIPTVDFKVPTQ